jgi:hypothetical protein
LVTAVKSEGTTWLARLSAPAVPAGIYGTVICASVLAAAQGKSTIQVAAVVVVTLIVYWMAERYSEVLGLAAGEESAGQSKITPERVRAVLGSGWAMIQASVTPLIVMLISRLAGASSELAVNIALVYTVLLLVALGWIAATRALLAGWGRVAATGFTAVLGLIVVVLKTSLH